jgi:hypothetical protein
MYVNLYPKLAEIARKHGYAMAVHGSLASDMDLICIPWVENPGTPFDVCEEIISTFDIRLIGNGPTKKLHNREVWTISLSGSAYLDLSFMPVEQMTGVVRDDLG